MAEIRDYAQNYPLFKKISDFLENKSLKETQTRAALQNIVVEYFYSLSYADAKRGYTTYLKEIHPDKAATSAVVTHFFSLSYKDAKDKKIVDSDLLLLFYIIQNAWNEYKVYREKYDTFDEYNKYKNSYIFLIKSVAQRTIYFVLTIIYTPVEIFKSMRDFMSKRWSSLFSSKKPTTNGQTGYIKPEAPNDENATNTTLFSKKRTTNEVNQKTQPVLTTGDSSHTKKP